METNIWKIYLLLLLGACAKSPDDAELIRKNYNPLVPGYFADPTIKKYGDTYYLYSTTDGIKLASGEPQVWISKDFVNWFNYEMDLDIPEGLTNVWAPDSYQGKDGRYYFFMGNCQFGCNIYGYVSDTPMGPWAPLNNGEPVIEVGTGLKHLPALDAQYLIDDDGSIYAYFGTWCTSFGGMGWVKIDPEDNFKILESGAIPISEIPDAFEAVYPLKRNGKYFLMYSSGDCRLSSYAVHYSVSDSPVGPFTYGRNSPILETNEDEFIDSPGHHSVLKEGDDYYILYHRHDMPHSTGGMFRQICADRMFFEDDETILPVEPTHTGIGYLAPNQIPYSNLAHGSRVAATSYYHLTSKATRFSKIDVDHEYLPEYSVDENNGTLWKAAYNRFPESLVVDLGKVYNVKRVMTQFEYPTFYYQYQLECSTDSVNWDLFADKSTNRRSGSPMIDDHDLKARYVKLTLTGAEKAGLFPAVWNIKVYDTLFEIPEYENRESPDGPGQIGKNELLVHFDAENLTLGSLSVQPENLGTLGGVFHATGNFVVEVKDQVQALKFDGSGFLHLSRLAPGSLDWNSSFTASVWVNNPEIGEGECLMVWNSRSNMLQGSYAAMMYGTGPYGAVAHGDGYVDLAYEEVPPAEEWHHIVLTFDGMKESLYVNGTLMLEQPINLFVESARVLIGGSGHPQENFSGYVANALLFDKSFNSEEVLKLMEATNPFNLL